MTPAELYPGFDLNAPAIKAPIEPGVRPLCDALNSLSGVNTLWSCEGHPEDGSRPYATFIAPSEIAFAIHQVVSPLNVAGGLNFIWDLVATFRDDGTIQYTIQPNDYRISEGTWWRWWSRNRWSRRSMSADLERLAVLVKQLL